MKRRAKLRDRLPTLVAMVALLTGLVLALWPAEGYTPSMPQIRVGIGASLTAAAVLLLMQAWFILDPAKTLEESSRELQSLLTQTLATRLPEGVAHLYLSTEQAPSFAEILHNASHIRFYGPEGAELLQHIVHQAATRQPGSSVNVMMVVPRDPDFLYRSVNPRWTAGSPRWNAVYSQARKLEAQGTLQLTIKHIDKLPTISAFQVDNTYYQVTMLFPEVPDQRRPTLVLHPRIGDVYFGPLWQFLA